MALNDVFSSEAFVFAPDYRNRLLRAVGDTAQGKEFVDTAEAELTHYRLFVEAFFELQPSKEVLSQLETLLRALFSVEKALNKLGKDTTVILGHELRQKSQAYPHQQPHQGLQERVNHTTSAIERVRARSPKIKRGPRENEPRKVMVKNLATSYEVLLNKKAGTSRDGIFANVIRLVMEALGEEVDDPRDLIRMALRG